jgi:hypothetical protein
VPAKFEPVAVTGVPEAPEGGYNVNAGAEGTMNVANP